MPALLEMAPDAHLVVVGHGPYEKSLRRLVERLGVSRAVTFTAFDSDERAALGDLVRASDVVALLSDYEANPVALMEALALGRKVVVAATSGLRELATEGLATAVAPDIAPADLASVLARVAHEPSLLAPAFRHGTAASKSSSASMGPSCPRVDDDGPGPGFLPSSKIVDPA